MSDMRDDDPWKPPTDGGPGPDAPSGPFIPPPPPSPPAPSAHAPAAPAPAIPAPAAPAPAAPPHHTDGVPLVADDAPLVTSGGPPERSKRSKLLVGGAVAAVIAVGAAGVFAVSNLTGAPQGGAASPDELGMTLLRAIESEDVLGMVDVLSPGERDVFRDPLVDLVSELTRLEVLSTDADLSRILGIDVELSNESVSATPTNVPDITNIDLRADAVLSLDGSAVPIGELITDNVPADMLTELRGTRLTETDELDVRLTAVEEDGRWYFSVFHTIAEVARQEAAPGALIPAEGIGAAGAESPDVAFDGLLDRVEALDLTGLLRTLNPGEAAALQRYAPLFLDDAEEALDEVPLQWQITRREFRVDETGDTATVLLDAIGIEGSIEGEPFSLEYADGCIRASSAGESFEQCSDSTFQDTMGFLDDAPETERLVEIVTEAFADMEETGLELRRTGDLWYVSPSTTVTEAVLNVLRALDRTELDAIIEQAPAVGEELADDIFAGFEELPGSFGDEFGTGAIVEETSPPASVDVEIPDASEGSTGSEGSEGSTGSEGSPEDCYSIPDPDEATACFQAAVDAGEVDSSFVPVVLRHPECGYTESWGGAVYSLPDEEFIAAAEAARPCFLDLVERGVVSEYELPTEISHLECFEGRNWYNIYDDPEYDQRYYDCLDG